MIDRRSVIAAGLAAGGLVAGARGDAQAGAPARAVGDPVLGPPPPGIPEMKLRLAFSLSIFFAERIRIQSNQGRVFVPCAGGEIWGPRLQGRVVPYSGADYAGGHGLDASYALEASDGTRIYIENHGYMKRMDGQRSRAAPAPRAPGEVPNQNFEAPADSAVPLRMRLMPVFDAPSTGPHAWMNKTIFVGHGGRYQNPDHTIFTYYEVL